MISMTVPFIDLTATCRSPVSVLRVPLDTLPKAPASQRTGYPINNLHISVYHAEQIIISVNEIRVPHTN